jgi:hypothetical protein
MQELCHSGARAPPVNPETRNTDQRNQSLGLCSWIPGPALTGRPGMTGEFFRTLLVVKSDASIVAQGREATLRTRFYAGQTNASKRKTIPTNAAFQTSERSKGTPAA